mgnify:CR=1 FL=1
MFSKIKDEILVFWIVVISKMEVYNLSKKIVLVKMKSRLSEKSFSLLFLLNYFFLLLCLLFIEESFFGLYRYFINTASKIPLANINIESICPMEKIPATVPMYLPDEKSAN